MATLAAIRAGLRTRLATLAGVHVYDEWPDRITPPACLIRLPRAEHQLTFGADMSRISGEVHTVVSLKGGLANAERALEPYISNSGAASVLLALDGDRYLNNTINYLLIQGWRDYDTVDIGGAEYLDAVLDWEAYTR